MKSNPLNPIRNIRVLLPGFDDTYAAKSPFHPYFIKSLSRFNTLRFKDWQGADSLLEVCVSVGLRHVCVCECLCVCLCVRGCVCSAVCV